MSNSKPAILQQLQDKFGEATILPQQTADGIATAWVPAGQVKDVLRYLRVEIAEPYRMLYDLSAIDERARVNRQGQPASDFTVFYHLLSYARNEDIRLKVALCGEKPSLETVCDLWPAANWYEREVWDMFGITIDGHPHHRRILMPPWWEGHPLRKEHPARATEIEPFSMNEARQAELEESLVFDPEEWGMARHEGEFDVMFLNIGPNHPGTHGVLRVILQMDGQQIVDLACDIGYHHRGAEKMAERQSWHTFIPYTDRVDYLGGVMNNLPYVMAVEKLAGIEVPDRAKVIRIMLAELYRIQNHFLYYGTFAQDLGMMSPIFYLFADRERGFAITEAITGARMHPSWFRIGGVAQDLPSGWDTLVKDFLAYLPGKLNEYQKSVLGNRIFKARTQGVGALSAADAMDWGATGPMLRSTGVAWDFRKNRPYGGYDQFEFDIPTGSNGDCYDRALVHAEEMRQSLRIIEQCVKMMPPGDYKARHPLAVPPSKERTLHDIETLIDHFLGVSWGPVIPPGEAAVGVEAVKGNNSYYLISDGSTMSYRTRIRTPSFAHIQMLPMLGRGTIISDLIAIMGSIDFVLSDVDR